MTCQSLCAPGNTLTSVARQLLDSRTRALLLRLLFARVLCFFSFIEIFIRAWFACSQRASLRRSLGGGHFDALGTSIASCALRHRASGTMKFAKLSNEASREASPLPCLVDLLHRFQGGTTCRGQSAWLLSLDKKVEPKPLEPLR